MAHLSYKEFTDRFGLDLTLTEYVKAMYLEAPVFGIGVFEISDAYLVDAYELQGRRYDIKLPANAALETTIRSTKCIYSEGFNTVYDKREFIQINVYDMYAVGNATDVYLHLPFEWTDEQCKAYLRGKKVLYKLKYVDITDKGTAYNFNCVAATLEFVNQSNTGRTYFIPIKGAHKLDIVVNGVSRLGIGQLNTIVKSPETKVEPNRVTPDIVLYPTEIPYTGSISKTVTINTTVDCEMLEIYLNGSEQIGTLKVLMYV